MNNGSSTNLVLEDYVSETEVDQQERQYEGSQEEVSYTKKPKE